jgi:sugar phosphate permease
VASLAAAIDVLSGRRKVFYGWWLLAASVCAMALGSGVSFWSFGLYVEPLEDQFGWTRAEVSLGFSISLLLSGLSGPLVGRWVDARGPRSSIILGAALTAASYLLLATTQELWQWYAWSSVNAVVRQMMFFIPFMALVSRWFDRRRGIAASILGTGFSLGGFIVVPIMSVLIEALGWQGALIASGVAIAALFLPIALFVVRNSPADVGVLPDGGAVPEDASKAPLPAAGLTLREALRTPLFWTLAFALMLFFYGMFGWLVHQVPFYESVGISRGNAAAIVSIAALCSIVTRLLVGVIADRIPRFELAAVGLAVALMASMLTLITSTAPAAIAVFLIFWVIGTAGGPMMEAMLLTRSFGVAHFATILGAIMVVETAGQIVSPTVAGAIYDRTGEYDWALRMFLGTFFGSFALFLVALRLPHPVGRLAVDSEAATLAARSAEEPVRSSA